MRNKRIYQEKLKKKLIINFALPNILYIFAIVGRGNKVKRNSISKKLINIYNKIS